VHRTALFSVNQL